MTKKKTRKKRKKRKLEAIQNKYGRTLHLL